MWCRWIKCKVELLANNEYFKIGKPSIITVPQAVFHGLEFEPGSQGYLISLSSNAVEQMLKYDVEVIYELDTISIYFREQLWKKFAKKLQQNLLKSSSN